MKQPRCSKHYYFWSLTLDLLQFLRLRDGRLWNYAIDQAALAMDGDGE